LSSFRYLSAQSADIVSLKNYLFPSSTDTFTLTITNILSNGSLVITGSDRTDTFIDRTFDMDVSLYYNVGDTINITASATVVAMTATNGVGVAYRNDNLFVYLYNNGSSNTNSSITISQPTEIWLPPFTQYIITYLNDISNTVIKITLTPINRNIKTDYFTKSQILAKNYATASKATTSTLGLVKGGGNISIDANGTLSAVIPSGSTATTSSLGIVKGGGNISIAVDGTLSAVIPTVSTATSSSLGLVKGAGAGGGNVSINADGSMSSTNYWSLSAPNIYNLNLGNVGIGTNNPSSYKFQVNGAIGSSGNITAFYSDERLKEITEYVSDVLPILSKIKVFRYNCNDLAASYGYDKNTKEIGLSAQEIQKYYPEVVSIAPFDATTRKGSDEIISKSGENYLTLDYERLVPVLLQGIKDLNNELNDIKTRLKKLEI
jgi:hypothetical protein